MLERTKRILFRIYSVFIQGGLRTFTPAPTGSGSATLRVKSIKNHRAGPNLLSKL